MAFSGALTITDLDDFLNPSQACIIPVRQSNKVAGQENGINGSTEIHIDANNNYYEVSTYSTTAGPSTTTGLAERKALEKAEINLNDCLACSGCITSTESLLITLQSQNEVLEFIEKHIGPNAADARIPVLSISPQTLASLSASISASSGQSPIPLLTLLRRIRAFLSQPEKGGWQVWDTTFARHLSLMETRVEYLERRQGSGKGKEKAGLPILASACPGWICYAEKAQGDLLPLLSAVRSSQAIMGGLVKTWWAARRGLSPDQVYHVTAMPCYDKKLEASRSDFYSSMYSTRDTDCVLTTGELDLLLGGLGFNPLQPTLSEIEDEARDKTGSPWPELLNHAGSSSGSYLQTLISSISASHPNATRLTTREIRGSTDNVEYLLEDVTTGQIIFKGAKCYGFRNLQNLVRKVSKETGLGRAGAGSGGGVGGARASSKLSAAVAARRRKAVTASAAASGTATPTSTSTADGSDMDNRLGALGARLQEDKKLDFVEVMACPGGCVNGGGQMKPVTKRAKPASEGNMTMDMEVDEEGYPRPLPDDGTEGVDEGLRWSTKEWVAKVEDIYWTGLPTPPPSPKAEAKGLHAHCEPEEIRLRAADELAEVVIKDVCGDDADKRWEYLRTRYRKVEGDILGGGVSHEAVKW